jgi:hypothetical protein
MRVLLSLIVAAALPAGDVWVRSPYPYNGDVRRVPPEVHSAEVSGDFMEVRSAGVSLHYWGMFQPPADPAEGPRQMVFRIPLRGEPAGEHHSRLPRGATGVFVNGVPITNWFEEGSYQERNLWHYDSVARNRMQSALVDNLMRDMGRHSPIIGYALDGYPVYGPWGFRNADGSGGLRRMRSSYRVRRMRERSVWPDGRRLTADQAGPEVGADFPLGTFAEDYEYARGSGDLDEFNGRFAVTPEYPAGTYAYYLSTGEDGEPAFPYLMAFRYYGRVPEESALKRAGQISSGEVTFSWEEARAGAEVGLGFRFTAGGEVLRHLEQVHERPVHVLVVSEDLREFSHIHPEPGAGDEYRVRHTFAKAGRHRIFAEFSAPGSAQQVVSFDLDVKGVTGEVVIEDVRQAWLDAPEVLRAGETVELVLRPEETENLERFLGAWGHMVILEEGMKHFIHAHPGEGGVAHHQNHGASMGESPPTEIRFAVSFPEAGRYKAWAQFQRGGRVITAPFVLRVQ